MALFWLFCLLNIRHAVLSIDHAYGMPAYKLSLATRLHGKWLIEDDLIKRSAKHVHKSTLVTQTWCLQHGVAHILRMSHDTSCNVMHKYSIFTKRPSSCARVRLALHKISPDVKECHNALAVRHCPCSRQSKVCYKMFCF